jgi:hypothetical protein
MHLNRREQSSVVNRRVQELTTKSFNELAALPSLASEDLVLNNKKHTLSVWHDTLESGEHRIVVQLYKHGILGVGRMLADGFVIDSTNHRRSLSQDELAPFV